MASFIEEHTVIDGKSMEIEVEMQEKHGVWAVFRRIPTFQA